MIVLRTDFAVPPSSPTVTGDGEAVAGANDFLLQLLAQLHEVETSAVAPAALPVSLALPDASLGEIPEPSMETVTPQQLDDERHVLEQLLHMLHDLISEVLGPFPQVPDTPAVPHEDGGVFAPQHGSAFELPLTAPAPPSLQSGETASVPVPAPTGVVVELDEYTASSGSGPVPDEVVLPVVAQTVEVEPPDGETRPNEPGLPGESDQQLTSRTAATTTTQQPVHEGNTLGNAPGTPSVAGAAASVVSAVAEESAAAEPLAATDRADDAPIPPIRTLTPLRSLSVPRNTVVLQVEPPELGTLVVQVRQVDEHFTASFWAESSEVRSLLQGHFPALNQALSQQGFQVAQLALNMHLGQGFAGHSGGFAQQHAVATAFSRGQPGEEHEPLDAVGRRFAGATSPGYDSGHVDITI